jgi:excisionase family DNA binding protein
MKKKATGEQLVNSPSLKRLLRVKEVAAILGVSEVKVYGLLKTGLPSVKIDGARRIQPEKLAAWIEQHCA